MKMKHKTVQLSVAEAISDDTNMGNVRIDMPFKAELGMKWDDIVCIEGKRKTFAVLKLPYPGDIGLRIIRMDMNTRSNADVVIGDQVRLSKATLKPAKMVEIAPDYQNINFELLLVL